MDLETNDLAQIRQAVQKSQGAYTLPKALEATTPTGCATNLPTWNGNHRVAMICFNSGKPSDPTEPDLFLFITDSLRGARRTADECSAVCEGCETNDGELERWR